VVADTLAAVRGNRAGGTIYVLALDAMHLPYSWDEACEVPHDDFTPRVDFIRWHWSEAEVGAVRRRYENAAWFADRLCERLVSGLDAEGRLAKSLVVITGDHGEELHEFGTWSHGSRMHRFQTEVPIVVKWPKGVESRHRHSIAGHLDIMPSVLDCARIPTECRPPLDGRSLLDPPRDRAVVSTTMGDERTPSLCLVDREGKAVFGCSRRDDRLPTVLHLQRWTDLDDAPSPADPESHEDRVHHRFGAWLRELGVSTKGRPPR
jgi:arylsulfatase A-like enzyme